MIRSIALAAVVLVPGLLGAACTATGAAAPAAASGPSAAGDAGTAETTAGARERALAGLFPELAAEGGPITRARIEALLAPPAEPRAPELPELAAVRDALAADDLDAAHALLAPLVLERRLSAARAELAAGAPDAALVLADAALAVAPADAGALLVRGEAELAVATSDADADAALLERALADLERAAELLDRSAEPGARAADAARAWIGASDAARRLGRPERAIELARRALPRPGTAVEAAVALGARRALAEATLDAHAAVRAEGDAARADELYRAAHGAVAELIERRPDDPSGFLLGARLERQAGAPDAAREALLAGLARAPADEALHAALHDLLREGDEALAVATWTALRDAHPDVVPTRWYPAVDRFERALAALRRGEDASAAFRAAEEGFAECRALDPARADAALEREVLCRAGAGWSLFAAGDFEGAKQAFLSMDQLVPWSGLARELPGFGTGVQGLSEVADASARLGRDANSLERAGHMERASTVLNFLHEYEPRELRWAVAAGAQSRDTAILLEQRARALARGGDTAQANRLLTRARELMEHSYRAYADAIALAPDDLASLSEAGSVLTNYLQRDAPLAERTLERAVAAGSARLPAARAALDEPELDDAERTRRQRALEELEIALGDVYQDLGVLNLTLGGDPGAARRWFMRARDEGGPDPRPEIDAWLARCDAAEAGATDVAVREKNRWAAPIAP